MKNIAIIFSLMVFSSTMLCANHDSLIPDNQKLQKGVEKGSVPYFPHFSAMAFIFQLS